MADKPSIFISHIVHESPIAITLQRYLEAAFGLDHRIFVSSDKKSIGGGTEWYEHILSHLRGARVVLVLVSQESANRPWINFEAGFGNGADASVIPISTMNFSLAKLGFPLGGKQGRPIEDIENILADITRITNRTAAPIDAVRYREELRQAEASVTYRSIVVTPVTFKAGGVHLRYKMRNTGNVDLDLLMLETWTPLDVIDPAWSRHGYKNTLSYYKVELDGMKYLYCAYTTIPTSQIDSLRPVLTPSMAEVEIFHPTIPLRTPLLDAHADLRLYHHMHVRSYSTERDAVPISAIQGL